MIFHENSEILSKKRVLGLGFSEKHHSEANKLWQAAKQGSHLSKFLQILKLISTFRKNWGFVPPPICYNIFIYNPVSITI